MKKLLSLSFVLFLIAGCSLHQELSISEINLAHVNGDVKQFINQITMNEDGTGNGIYIFQESKERFYLYLSQEFVKKDKTFGNVDILSQNNSLNLYINESSSNQEEKGEKYKLYKVNAKKGHEFLNVFKNGEETFFQTIGG